MKNYICVICTIVLISFATGCAKLPERCFKPTVQIAVEEREGNDIYLLQFTSVIINENSDVALQDITGEFHFIKNKKNNEPVFSIPFEIPVILPFGDEEINVEREYTLNEISPLVNLIGGDTEKLAGERGMESTLVDDSNIELEIKSYKKRDILELLKDKV